MKHKKKHQQKKWSQPSPEYQQRHERKRFQQHKNSVPEDDVKAYPTIPRGPTSLVDTEPRRTWFVYDKLDGSNIRAEWSKTRGWHKFGTRHQLLTDEHETLNKSKELIMAMSEDIERQLCDQKLFDVTCFFEFYGPSSFAGSHVQDEAHQVSLLDVNVQRQGIMPPDVFNRLFSHLAPSLLHVGPIDRSMFDEVMQGTYPGITFEGVVAKTAPAKRFTSTPMFKVKALAWLKKLREKCTDDQEFERLK